MDEELTVVLPDSPTRPELRGFALVAGAGIGAAALGSGLWLGAPTVIRAGLLGGGVLAVLGLARPDLARVPYGAWNALARFCARAGGYWTSGALFYVLLPLIGKAGTRLPWGPPATGGSGWRPREDRPARDPRRGYACQHRGETRSGLPWPRPLWAWARDRGNAGWAWGLLPLLTLLRVFRPRIRSSLGENIYTLY